MKRLWRKWTANWLIRLVVFAIALVSGATDASAYMRFVPNLGVPPWTAIPCVIAVKFVEWTFLIFAFRLWAKGRWGKCVCLVTVFPWCIAVALSTLAAFSSLYGALDSGERSGAKNAETRADLTARIDDITSRIDALSKPAIPRPVETLQALLWIGLPGTVRHATRDCTRFRDDSQREACRVTIDLRGELARRLERDRLTHDADVLRDRREALGIQPAQDPMQHAFEATIGKVTRINGKDGIAFMVALLLDLVSALGPFGIEFLNGHRREDDRDEHEGGSRKPARDFAQRYPREVAHVTPSKPAQAGPAITGSVSASYAIMKKAMLSLSYRRTMQSS